MSRVVQVYGIGGYMYTGFTCRKYLKAWDKPLGLAIYQLVWKHPHILTVGRALCACLLVINPDCTVYSCCDLGGHKPIQALVFTAFSITWVSILYVPNNTVSINNTWASLAAQQ